ncbi:hypothetical protein [Streptomyces sp. NBC_01262]|uniref:hypothetical protein n=1 Tax=Streptomyces sp. NBC_01262 TaxID=2903803 RepID=UPI002E30934C|nr:hypothetical protein [Streptomyces sp. NBC_01262]
MDPQAALASRTVPIERAQHALGPDAQMAAGTVPNADDARAARDLGLPFPTGVLGTPEVCLEPDVLDDTAPGEPA